MTAAGSAAAHTGGICSAADVSIDGDSAVESAAGTADDARAIDGTVKSAAAGVGWTETGTAEISVNTDPGQTPDYGKVRFPAILCVTFLPGSGSGDMDPQTVPYDTETALEENTFTPPGGGLRPRRLDGRETTYADGEAVTLTEDTELTAVWAFLPAAPGITAQPEDLSLTVGYAAGPALSVTAAADAGADYEALTYHT